MTSGYLYLLYHDVCELMLHNIIIHNQIEHSFENWEVI